MENSKFELIEFVITYFPFLQSDMTIEQTEFGKDEEDAIKAFRERAPAWRVKGIRAK